MVIFRFPLREKKYNNVVEKKIEIRNVVKNGRNWEFVLSIS